MTSPIRPTDDNAKALISELLAKAKFAALAYSDPDDGTPMISRIALVQAENGTLLSLASDLSHHSRGLKMNPVCSLLVGEPGAKGDPLSHPRVSLRTKASFITHNHAEHEKLAQDILRQQPKAKLYIGFKDMSVLRFRVLGANLNGGFGRAYVLKPEDIDAP